MPDLPAPGNRSAASSLQRWQSLANVGGCMGAFSQMFHLNRMLGGSNNYLATPDARPQNLGSKPWRRDVEKQSSLRGEETEETERGIDLRKILDAKQEPFVLQDVIWEKRNPVRTRSSRELKFELNDIVPSARKSQNSKRVKSKDNRKHFDASRDDDLSAPSHRTRGASSALVKGNTVPAESMVALPSNQASPHVRKTRSSLSKTSSAGKSPVKSPNKKALLMEAAAKILEGSNRRASKMPSSSARSLLRELDESKKAQEVLKPKEAPMKKDSFEVEATTKQKSPLQNVSTLEQMQIELSKQHFHGNADKSFSFANQFKQDSPSSLNSSFEMTDEDVLMILQSRIYPSDEMPAARGEPSHLATPADSSDVPQQLNHVQGPNAHFSKVDIAQEERLITQVDEQLNHVQGPNAHFFKVDIAQEERLITQVDVSMDGMHSSADLRPAEEQTHREVEFVMVSEIIGRNHRHPDRVASGDRSKGLELAPNVDSSNINFINELPVQEYVNSLEWNTPPKKSQVETSKDLHGLPMSREVSVDDIDCVIKPARSGNCETTMEDIASADAYTFSDIDSNEFLKSYTSTGDNPGISKEITSEKVDTTENAPTPVLLLCNYSWWTQEEIQAHSSTLKNETSNECVGYGSPIVATKGPCVVKIFEERKEGENLEEDSSTSSDHSYAEEFQQSTSPVSVLDAVYDDGPVLGKPFDYFDEARQKLLESVRRYEMLAHMDLDMLIQINEESLCHDFEEESDKSDTYSFKESRGSDITDICATHHQVPLMGSPDYQLSRYGGFSNVEAEGLCLDSAYAPLYEATEDDLYIHSDEDLYIQQLQELADEDVSRSSDFMMDVRARFKAERESGRCKALLDCSSEPSDVCASKGPHLRSSRTNSSRDTLEEVEKLTNSVVINVMLHMDLTTSSWSSFHEEMEVMEMELESSLFAALIQELLSELLY